MNISQESRNIISEEFLYIKKEMEKAPDSFKKLFLFSGTYSIVQRIFNFDFDPVLVLIHLVLQITYDRINGRLNQIVSGVDRAVELPTNIIDDLEILVGELAKNIKSNDDKSLILNLQKITILAYITTGNGYYLFQKGILKI